MAKRNNDKDYYEVLQVHRKAEQEVIDAAYRKLAQKYHPDVSKDPNAAQRMKEINVAYEVLSDPNRRMEYDKHLEAKRGFKAAAQYKKEQLTASHFLVEFRLHGYAKKYAKWARARAHREARRLGIKELKGQRPVSHITLFGSAETNNLRRVIAEVERIGLKYTLIPFKIDGLSYFNNPDKKVIYLDVDPSLELEQFRRELAESLIRISTKYTEWDTKQKYKFHSTIGEFITSNDSKFEKLYNCVETKCSLKTFK